MTQLMRQNRGDRTVLDQNQRWILLQAFAEADEEYGQLLQKTADVDDLLENLKQELSKEQMDTVQKVIAAYSELARRTSEVACKYMIFHCEVK